LVTAEREVGEKHRPQGQPQNDTNYRCHKTQNGDRSVAISLRAIIK
jgi:hypothetical protein